MNDSQIYPLSSRSAAAVELYNAAVADFLDYRLSAMETLKKALEKDEQFIMGHVLRGYMLMMMNTSTVHAPAMRQSMPHHVAAVSHLHERRACPHHMVVGPERGELCLARLGQTTRVSTTGD